MGLDHSRWRSIWLLAQGRFGEAPHEAQRLWARLPEEFAMLVAYELHERNYARAYDLLRHQWPGESK